MYRLEIEQKVVDLEWEMFQQVKGIDGRAPCQDQMKTFIIMRMSQYESWDIEVVESYLKDLEEAKANGRNLVMEKYAYMMEETDPGYFAQIKHLLPEVSDEAKIIIEKIVAHFKLWVEEFAIHYPNIRKNGRPAEASSVDGTTSLINYLKSELATYSLRTLERFVVSIMANKELNRYWLSMEKMVQFYGYKSLDEAEADLIGK